MLVFVLDDLATLELSYMGQRNSNNMLGRCSNRLRARALASYKVWKSTPQDVHRKLCSILFMAERIYIRAGTSGFVCGCLAADDQWCQVNPTSRHSNIKRHIETRHPAGESQQQIRLVKIELNTTEARTAFNPFDRNTLQHLLEQAFQSGRILQLPPHLRPAGTRQSTISQSPNVGIEQRQPHITSSSSLVLPAIGPGRTSNTHCVTELLPPISQILTTTVELPQSTHQSLSGEPTQTERSTLSRRKRPDEVDAADITPPLPRRVRLAELTKITRGTHGIEQIKALQWLSADSYIRFDIVRSHKLSMWGLGNFSLTTGPCVQWPSDWNGLEVDTIIYLLFDERKKFPDRNSHRLTYKYQDHGTSFSRTQAWYSEWPRTLDELAVLLDCSDPSKKRDGSHLCHRQLCLLHLWFELSSINHDRKSCHIEAIRLRRCRMPVPVSCDKHDPPCLMQHAALTTIEAFMIQISMYLHANRRPNLIIRERIDWPKNHRFHTFETRLPLEFSTDGDAFQLPPEYTKVPSAPANKVEEQIPQVCGLCVHIKHLATFNSFAGHIVRMHVDAPVNRKLAELKRVADHWYCRFERTPHGQSRTQRTRLMIDECRSEGFDWKSVEAWGLKGLDNGSDVICNGRDGDDNE